MAVIDRPIDGGVHRQWHKRKLQGRMTDPARWAQKLLVLKHDLTLDLFFWRGGGGAGGRKEGRGNTFCELI
jgi:hypothetical protein